MNQLMSKRLSLAAETDHGRQRRGRGTNWRTERGEVDWMG